MYNSDELAGDVQQLLEELSQLESHGVVQTFSSAESGEGIYPQIREQLAYALSLHGGAHSSQSLHSH